MKNSAVASKYDGSGENPPPIAGLCARCQAN
ncbi:MAG: hypothetical protein ACI9HK_006087, partial [Pirellulaceae bacterium]